MQVAIVFHQSFEVPYSDPEIIGVFLSALEADDCAEKVSNTWIEYHRIQDAKNFNIFPLL